MKSSGKCFNVTVGDPLKLYISAGTECQNADVCFGLKYLEDQRVKAPKSVAAFTIFCGSQRSDEPCLCSLGQDQRQCGRR